jgi:hypothetical protein
VSRTRERARSKKKSIDGRGGRSSLEDDASPFAHHIVDPLSCGPD